MALKLVKDTEQQLSPHRQALADNLKAITDLREKLNAVAEKDRAAAADQALADATAQQIATLQQEVDTARADAVYEGGPPPDVSRQEKQMAHLQQLHRRQQDTARAASLIRAKYSADMTVLHHAISTRAKAQPQILFDALREDCLAPLAAEFLEKEAAFLAIHKRVFAAALAVDTISMEQHYGQFVRAANINDLHISRPDHPAFNPHPLLPEQAVAAKRKYATDAAADAAALVAELLKD
jgi:hypothetical protein